MKTLLILAVCSTAMGIETPPPGQPIIAGVGLYVSVQWFDACMAERQWSFYKTKEVTRDGHYVVTYTSRNPAKANGVEVNGFWFVFYDEKLFSMEVHYPKEAKQEANNVFETLCGKKYKMYVKDAVVISERKMDSRVRFSLKESSDEITFTVDDIPLKELANN